MSLFSQNKLLHLLFSKFYIILFIILIIYLVVNYFAIDFHLSIFLLLFVLILSIVFYQIQSKIEYHFPFIAIGALIIFFSFFLQKIVFEISYSIIYLAGFAIVIASIVSAIQREKYNVVWIALIVLFFASAVPQLNSQLPIGDEPVYMQSLMKLESGQVRPESFGIHHYVNISPMYFYYIVIIAKIFSVSTVEIFFVLKLFFSFIVFLAFLLLASHLSNKKIGLMVALIAFIPTMNIHFAPQILGIFLIMSLFIYTYLKYFHLMRARILLIFLIVLLVYFNLTTLYISLGIFTVLVFIFLLQKLRKRRVYFTDLILLILFILLVFSYLNSIDFFQTTFRHGFLEPTLPGQEEPTVIPGEPPEPAKPLPPKWVEEGQPEPEGAAEVAVASAGFSLKRLNYFLGTYAEEFGLFSFIKYIIYFILLLVFVLYFLYKKEHRVLSHYAIGFFFLLFFLMLISFQQGAHAVLIALEIVFLCSIFLIFEKKPKYAIPLVLFFLAFNSVPYYFDISQGEKTFYDLKPYIQRIESVPGTAKNFEIVSGETKLFPQLAEGGSAAYYFSCNRLKPYEVSSKVLGHELFYIKCNENAELEITENDLEIQYRKSFDNYFIKNYLLLISEK